MRYIWIFFTAFALVFLSQGESLPTGHRKEEATSTGLPLESKVTTDDIIGHDPLISGIHSPNAPRRAAERTLKGINRENPSGDLKNSQSGNVEDGGFSLKTTSDPIDGQGKSPIVPNRATKKAFLNTNRGTKSRKVNTLSKSSEMNAIRIPKKFARILKSMFIISKLSTKSNVDNKSELAEEKSALVDKLATTDQPVEPGTDEPTNPSSKLEHHVDGVSPDLQRETTASKEMPDLDIAEDQFSDDSEFGDGKSPSELEPSAGPKPSGDDFLQKEEPLDNKTEADVLGTRKPSENSSGERLQGNDSSSREIFPKEHVLKGVQRERLLEGNSGFAKLKHGSSAHAPKISSKEALILTKMRTKSSKIKPLLASSNRTGILFSWSIPRFLKSKLEISEPPDKENVGGKNHLAKAKGARVLRPGKRASHKERRINGASSELQSNLTNVKGTRTLKPGKRASHKQRGIKVSSEVQSHLTNAKGAHGNETGKRTSQKENQIDRVNTFSQGKSDLEITQELVDDSEFGHENNVSLTEESSGNIGSGGERNVASIKRVERSSNGAIGIDDKQRISHHTSRKASEEVLPNSKEEPKASKVKALLSNTNTAGIRFSGKIARLLKMSPRIPEPSAKVGGDNPSHKGAQNVTMAVVDQSVDPHIEKPGELASRKERHVKKVFPGIQGNPDLGIADEVIHETSELVSSAVLKPSGKEVSETGDYLNDEEDTDWPGGSGDASLVRETIESGSGGITYHKITPNADFTIDLDSGGDNGGKYLSNGDSSREGQAAPQFSRGVSDTSTRSTKFKGYPEGIEPPHLASKAEKGKLHESGRIGGTMKPTSDGWLSSVKGFMLDAEGKTFTGSRGTDLEFIRFPYGVDDEDGNPSGNAEGSSSRKKRTPPENRDRFYKGYEGHIKVKERKQFVMPKSDFRWKGFAMARVRSRDGAPDEFVKTEGGILGHAVTTLSLVFLLGGSMLVLLFGIVFLVAIWPIRKYYDHLVRGTDRQDVEKGECGDELSSITVDSENPSERPSGSDSVNYTQCSQQGKTFVPIYHYPGNTRVGYEQPRYSGEAIYSLQKGTSGERDRRSPNKVATEDKRRDPRNAERRKIIKRKTFEKRGSLVDSLMTAKTVIDGHAKDKEFEEKALERRQKIKQYSSDPGLQAIRNNRRMSFVEEVQSACTVIKPNWIDEEKMEQSKEKRQKIRQQISSKKRPSLLDQIEVAKDLIMASDKKYSNELP